MIRIYTDFIHEFSQIFTKKIVEIRENSWIKIIVLMLSCLFIHLPVRAQDSNMRFWAAQDQAKRSSLSSWTPDFNYIFRSRVINDSTLSSIRDCHVINKTQRMGTVTDAYGDFKITANVNDSILFSAIGYKTLTIALTDSMYTYGHIIKLQPATYEIDEVIIRPILEIPLITKWEIYTKPLPGQGGINIPIGVSPITALYDRFSKEGKQKRYFKKVSEGTADFMLVGEKFNGEMVAQITGLKDDDLIKFMSWCNFSNDFLLNYSPETIKREIRKKYQEYVNYP